MVRSTRTFRGCSASWLDAFNINAVDGVAEVSSGKGSTATVSCGNGEDRVTWLALKNRSGGGHRALNKY